MQFELFNLSNIYSYWFDHSLNSSWGICSFKNNQKKGQTLIFCIFSPILRIKIWVIRDSFPRPKSPPLCTIFFGKIIYLSVLQKKKKHLGQCSLTGKFGNLSKRTSLYFFFILFFRTPSSLAGPTDKVSSSLQNPKEKGAIFLTQREKNITIAMYLYNAVPKFQVCFDRRSV